MVSILKIIKSRHGECVDLYTFLFPFIFVLLTREGLSNKNKLEVVVVDADLPTTLNSAKASAFVAVAL